MSKKVTREQTLALLRDLQERIIQRDNWLYLYHAEPHLRPQLAAQLRKEQEGERTE